MFQSHIVPELFAMSNNKPGGLPGSAVRLVSTSSSASERGTSQMPSVNGSVFGSPQGAASGAKVTFEDMVRTGNGYVDVTISHANSVDSFFVQSLKMRKDIERISNEVHSFAESHQQHPEMYELVPGFKCAARYSMDNGWYRAEVIERVGPTSFRVRFTDYGNVDVVLASKIRSYGVTQSFLTETPSLAVCCQLTGVEPRQIAGDTFRVTVEGREFVTRIDSVQYAPQTKYCVSLFYVRTNGDEIDVNGRIVRGESILPNCRDITTVRMPWPPVQPPSQQGSADRSPRGIVPIHPLPIVQFRPIPNGQQPVIQANGDCSAQRRSADLTPRGIVPFQPPPAVQFRAVPNVQQPVLQANGDSSTQPPEDPSVSQVSQQLVGFACTDGYAAAAAAAPISFGAIDIRYRDRPELVKKTVLTYAPPKQPTVTNDHWSIAKGHLGYMGYAPQLKPKKEMMGKFLCVYSCNEVYVILQSVSNVQNGLLVRDVMTTVYSGHEDEIANVPHSELSVTWAFVLQSASGEWCRGELLTDSVILCVDTGEKLKLTPSTILKPMYPDLVKIPALAMKCQLAGIESSIEYSKHSNDWCRCLTGICQSIGNEVVCSFVDPDLGQVCLLHPTERHNLVNFTSAQIDPQGVAEAAASAEQATGPSEELSTPGSLVSDEPVKDDHKEPQRHYTCDLDKILNGGELDFEEDDINSSDDDAKPKKKKESLKQRKRRKAEEKRLKDLYGGASSKHQQQSVCSSQKSESSNPFRTSFAPPTSDLPSVVEQKGFPIPPNLFPFGKRIAITTENLPVLSTTAAAELVMPPAPVDDWEDIDEDVDDVDDVVVAKKTPAETDLNVKQTAESKVGAWLQRQSTVGSEVVIGAEPLEENHVVDGLVRYYPPNPPPPEGRAEMFFSHVESPLEMYLQTEAQVEVAARESELLNTNVDMVESTEPSDVSFFDVNCACAVKFDMDQQWYRGRITQIFTDHDCIVNFVDYGNSQRIKLQEMKALPAVSRTPVSTYRCKLDGYICTNAVQQLHDNSLFHEYIDQKFMKYNRKVICQFVGKVPGHTATDHTEIHIVNIFDELSKAPLLQLFNQYKKEQDEMKKEKGGVAAAEGSA